MRTSHLKSMSSCNSWVLSPSGFWRRSSRPSHFSLQITVASLPLQYFISSLDDYKSYTTRPNHVCLSTTRSLDVTTSRIRLYATCVEFRSDTISTTLSPPLPHMARVPHPFSRFHRVPPPALLGCGTKGCRQCQRGSSRWLSGRAESCVFGRKHAPFHGRGHKRANRRRS